MISSSLGQQTNNINNIYRFKLSHFYKDLTSIKGIKYLSTDSCSHHSTILISNLIKYEDGLLKSQKHMLGEVYMNVHIMNTDINYKRIVKNTSFQQ